MLEGIRDRIAGAMTIIAERISSEPRHATEPRIARSYRTLAGVAITPDTAVTLSTVWACLRYLSQTVAVLPWHVMADETAGAKIQSRNSVDHLIYRRPNPEWSSFQFRETLTHWALRWGNGWGEIERDLAQRPIAIWPIHPDRAQLCRDPESKALYLEVDNGTGPKAEIPYEDVFHIRGFGEGVVGVNVISYAAESIGWAKAAQLFGSTFFGNGSNFANVVINKKPFANKGAARRQREEMEQLYKGPRNAHKLAVLDSDADVKRLGLNAEESQLIETHQHLVEEICRWFGVPPHKVMHLMRATFSNIEHQAIEVVVDSVSPWVKRFEDEADFKLFRRNRKGLYTKMNLRALLRGDFKSQNEGLEIARRNGVINAEEWRQFMDMGSIGADGKKYVMQSQYTTLERIGEEADPPEPDEPPSPVPEEDDEARALRRAFEDEFMAEGV